MSFHNFAGRITCIFSSSTTRPCCCPESFQGKHFGTGRLRYCLLNCLPESINPPLGLLFARSIFSLDQSMGSISLP